MSFADVFGSGGSGLTPDQAAIIANLGLMIDATGVSPEFTETALGNVPIPTLSGPNTVTISVVDHDTSAPLEGALVKLYRVGSGQETKATDANGEAVFTVVDATWQIGVTEGAHIGASDVIVVPSELSKVVALARKSFPSTGDPDAAMLRITCYSAGTAVAPGATVRLRMCAVPAGTQGGSFDGSIRELVADSNGIIDVEVFKDSVYQIQRGGSRQWERLAIGSDDNQFVKNFLGVDG